MDPIITLNSGYYKCFLQTDQYFTAVFSGLLVIYYISYKVRGNNVETSQLICLENEVTVFYFVVVE